ncbi:MAG: hypothetical protein V1790_07505 [Planctomycetota bacterium]
MTKPTGFLAVSIATCLSLMWLGCCVIVVGIDGGEDTGGGGSDVAPAGDNGDGLPPAGDNGDGTPLPGDNTDSDGGGTDVVVDSGADVVNADVVNDNSDGPQGAFRLDGSWLDHGRETRIVTTGSQVRATYVSKFLCDRDTGPVGPNEEPAPDADLDATFESFTGTLSRSGNVLPGDTITGTTSTCRSGYTTEQQQQSGLPNGLVAAPIVITVADENTLQGVWYDSMDLDGNGKLDDGGRFFTITRITQ